jgi:RHS repeat-associated protein
LQDDNLGGVALNYYDYGARYFDPVIGRFTTIDPHVEKYDMLTPYHYCFNNPIKSIDPNGKDSYTVDSNGNIKLLYKNDNKYDALVAVGESGKLDVKDGKLQNNLTIVDKGILSQKNHQEQDVDNDNFKGKVSRDSYSITTMDDKKSVGLFKFLAQNTKVEWSLTLGNDKEGNNSNLLTTTHQEGQVGSIEDYYQEKNGYNVRIDYHNHPPDSYYHNGNPNPSGKYGDIGHADIILNKSPKARFYIYTSGDNKMHEYYSSDKYEIH